MYRPCAATSLAVSDLDRTCWVHLSAKQAELMPNQPRMRQSRKHRIEVRFPSNAVHFFATVCCAWIASPGACTTALCVRSTRLGSLPSSPTNWEASALRRGATPTRDGHPAHPLLGATFEGPAALGCGIPGRCESLRAGLALAATLQQGGSIECVVAGLPTTPSAVRVPS
jgi:hypothetical protein